MRLLHASVIVHLGCAVWKFSFKLQKNAGRGDSVFKMFVLEFSLSRCDRRVNLCCVLWWQVFCKGAYVKGQGKWIFTRGWWSEGRRYFLHWQGLKCVQTMHLGVIFLCIGKSLTRLKMNLAWPLCWAFWSLSNKWEVFVSCADLRGCLCRKPAGSSGL